MVETGYAFRDSSDTRGTPVFKIGDPELTFVSTLFDVLRANFSGITLTQHGMVFSKVVAADLWSKPIADGEALQKQLQTDGGLRQAYVAMLSGQGIAVVIDYAPEYARSNRRSDPSIRTGPSFIQASSDPCKITAITLADGVYPTKDKLGIPGYQWEDERILLPSSEQGQRNLSFIMRWATRFARRASLSPKVD